MIFLDTSYLVGLTMPSDALHGIALAWSEVLSGPFLTTEFVLVEVVNMLSAPAHRPRVDGLVKSLYANRTIRVEPASSEWFQKGMQLHAARPDKSWSLTDCVSFAVMREVPATDALTHDRHFEQAGFRSLLRHSPPS